MTYKSDTTFSLSGASGQAPGANLEWGLFTALHREIKVNSEEKSRGQASQTEGKSDSSIRSDSQGRSHLREPAGSGGFRSLLSCVSGVGMMLSDLFICGGQVRQLVEETEPEEPQSSVWPLIC
ncbi:hypothetical protein SRHO_G00143820 [Serrasalmus rhombeus]